MPEDKPAPPDSAFQDLILELMVANQYLQEINQHSFRTAEYLGTIAQSVTGAPPVATVEPQRTEATVEPQRTEATVEPQRTEAAPLVATVEPQRTEAAGDQTPKQSNLERDTLVVAASLTWLINIQESLLLETTKGLGQIHSTLVGIDRGLEVIIDILAGNRLQALEDKKEKQTIGQASNTAKTAKTSSPLGSPLGFLGTIAAITVALTAFLSGVVAGITAMLSTVLVKIVGLINTLFTKLLKTYIGTKIIAFWSAITKSITTGLSSILEAFKNTTLFRAIRVSVLRFISGFKDWWRSFSFNNIFRTIKASLFLFLRGDIMTELKALFPILKRIQTWVTTIVKSVGTFGKYIGRIAAVFFKIGKVFGKFTGWVGIIMSAVGAIMDAVEAFKETGNIGEAVRVGITGFINAFSGGIIDLLKDAVSWIAGALGFKEVEKMLDSFSVSTIIESFVKRIFNWGQGLFESLFGNLFDVLHDISEAFSSGNITNSLFEILRGALKTLLALPADMLKNSIASLMGLFGAKETEDWLRSFSFQKMLGGTHTETLGEQKTSGKSVLGEGEDILIEKNLKKAKAKEKKEIEDNTKKKQNELNGQKEKDPITQFYDALIKAYRETNPVHGPFVEEGLAGPIKDKFERERLAGNIQSAIETNPSTAGATIDANGRALERERLAGNIPPVIQAAPPARKAQTNVTNNNQSVSYNNTPDRTDRAVSGWMSPYGFGAR